MVLRTDAEDKILFELELKWTKVGKIIIINFKKLGLLKLKFCCI